MLELYNMSVNNLVICMGKLRKEYTKENFQLNSGCVCVCARDIFVLKTKNLLFQIASRARYIHSLRIVHRDL